jgi:hypothetical protein
MPTHSISDFPYGRLSETEREIFIHATAAAAGQPPIALMAIKGGIAPCRLAHPGGPGLCKSENAKTILAIFGPSPNHQEIRRECSISLAGLFSRDEVARVLRCVIARGVVWVRSFFAISQLGELPGSGQEVS